MIYGHGRLPGSAAPRWRYAPRVVAPRSTVSTVGLEFGSSQHGEHHNFNMASTDHSGTFSTRDEYSAYDADVHVRTGVRAMIPITSIHRRALAFRFAQSHQTTIQFSSMQLRTHHQPTNTFSSACCQSSDMQICHLSRRLLPIPIHPSLKSVSIYIVSQISNQCSSFHQLLEALLLCNSVHGVPSVSSHTSTRVHTRCAQCKFTPNAKAGAQCVSDRCADRINKPNAKA